MPENNSGQTGQTAPSPDINTAPPIQVNTALLQVAGGQRYEVNLKTTAEQVMLGDGSTVATRLNTLEKTVSGHTNTYIKANIAERDVLTGLVPGDQCWVLDATADPTVEKGGAKYLYMVDHTWLKTGEAESMDIICDWNHIQGKPASAPADIDLAVAKQHVHANYDTLTHLSDDGAGNLLFKGKRINDGLVWSCMVDSVDKIPANLADGGLVFLQETGGEGGAAGDSGQSDNQTEQQGA